ncbi:hypothetical protein WJX74_005332 [Apatococcus lobatus]|uniref:AtC3H23-like CCCH zinc finger domain-containing protein n=1 Tax=Apatococcus lobatus TaxID=904363 RepID=A0AAW1QMU4_9CHLO
MYGYKIKVCPRKEPHDWVFCPFAHSGERAVRRDPRAFFYSSDTCPDYQPSKGDMMSNGGVCAATTAALRLAAPADLLVHSADSLGGSDLSGSPEQLFFGDECSAAAQQLLKAMPQQIPLGISPQMQPAAWDYGNLGPVLQDHEPPQMNVNELLQLMADLSVQPDHQLSLGPTTTACNYH